MPISLFFPYTTLFRSRVFGFEQLRNFRFSASKPVTNLQISSGIDWFDAQVEVVYGDQKVGIRDIKRALANKQNRSEEHTSELQSRENLVCRLLLAKKK